MLTDLFLITQPNHAAAAGWSTAIIKSRKTEKSSSTSNTHTQQMAFYNINVKASN